MEILRLTSLDHLRGLSFQQLSQLAPCASERWVPAGGRLLLRGPLHHELVLIAGGRAVVRCAGEQVAQLGPGDTFGELAPQRAVYTTARVVALTDLRLVLFSTCRLRRLAQTAPDAVAALIRTGAIAEDDDAVTRCGDRHVPHLRLVPVAGR